MLLNLIRVLLSHTSKPSPTKFRKNFPEATVYHQCANVLLNRAIQIYHNNKELPQIKDLGGNKMPELPSPGVVDFIYCGPPW